MKFAFLIEPPFNFKSETGKLVGCDVDLARHVFDEMGVTFEPLETEFANLLPGLEKEHWHMTTGMFATDERKELAEFTRPIWALPDGILVKRGNPFGLEGYRSVAQAKGCLLAVVRDQIQHSTAINLGVAQECIRVFETYTDAAKAVETGDVHAYVSVARAHGGFLARNPDYDCETVLIPSSEKEPAFGSFALRKTDGSLRAAIDEILNTLIGSTKHRDMMKRYGFKDREVDLILS